MDELKQNLFNICMELLDDIANTPSDPYYGTPPQTFYIDFAVGNDDQLQYYIKEPMETYRYAHGELQKVATGTKPALEPKSGMYFSEGLAGVAIHTERSAAYIWFQVGKLYGRGYEVSIERTETGAVLGERRGIWIS